MKLKFTVLERLSFNILFPKDDDMVTLRLSRDIKDKIDLSKEEMEKINFKVVKSEQGNSYTWDDSLADKIGSKYWIDFTEAEVRFLKERVNKLNDAKKIPDSSLTLCEKIIDSKADILVDKVPENIKDTAPEEASKQK